MKTFVQWAVGEGLAVGEPLAYVDPPPAARKLPKHVTREELDAICSAVDAHVSAAHRPGATTAR